MLRYNPLREYIFSFINYLNIKMQTQDIKLRFKPIRIGWCVNRGDLEGLKNAFELTHTLWGGRYNPIIPVGNDEIQNQIVKVFHVDILHPVSLCKEVNTFIENFPHLEAPFELRDVFDNGDPPYPRYLDVYHPIRQICERFSGRENKSQFITWEKDDPLSLVFSASFGSYPAQFDTYEKMYKQLPNCTQIEIDKSVPLTLDIYNCFTPSLITAYRTEFDLSARADLGGIFVGKSNNFDDLVQYWNLLAAGKNIWFYDLEHAGRLDNFKDSWFTYLEENTDKKLLFGDDGPKICIYTNDHQLLHKVFGEWKVLLNYMTPTSWNGLNIKPPMIYLTDSNLLGHSTIGILDDSNERLTIPLQNKPFFMDHNHVSGQQLVYSISSELPKIAKLNQYYGSNYYFRRFNVRAQVDGIGIIGHTYDDHITVKPLAPPDVIIELFKSFGIKATPSEAGLKAKRLIAQMSRLQSCRVFKIAGVRKLLNKLGKINAITRSTAIQIIQEIDGVEDKKTKLAEFQRKYGHLYIEAREQHNCTLSGENAFTYLLKKKVFQAGIECCCPNCLLKFWLPIDDIRTIVKCLYCDHLYNITPTLKDRGDWQFRRSGLFTMDEQGSVPIALLLQQMDTVLRGLYYCTSINLEPISAKITKCETDFVILSLGRDFHGVTRQQIIIGECKGFHKIERQDVDNLKRVMESLSNEGLEVFVLFSKLTVFSEEEIRLIKDLQPEYERRVIMLTDTQLEPYDMYQWTDTPNIEKHAVRLDDLANNTHVMYFATSTATTHTDILPFDKE